MSEIKGILTAHGRLTGTLKENGSLIAVLTVPNTIHVDIYHGEYEVTPRLFAQSLDTDGKLMQSDVTVYEIPITQTTNPTGGLTVLIG